MFKSSIDGFMSALFEAEQDVLELRLKIETTKRDLEKLQTKMVEAKQRVSLKNEQLRVAIGSQVIELVTKREVQIASMKGIELVEGQPMTPSIKVALFSTPMSEQMKALVESC